MSEHGSTTVAAAPEKAAMARLRLLLQPHFSPRRMHAFLPRVEELTRGPAQ